MYVVEEKHLRGREIRCIDCGEPFQTGQLVSFSYSVHRHVICPVEEPRKESSSDR